MNKSFNLPPNRKTSQKELDDELARVCQVIPLTDQYEESLKQSKILFWTFLSVAVVGVFCAPKE